MAKRSWVQIHQPDWCFSVCLCGFSLGILAPHYMHFRLTESTLPVGFKVIVNGCLSLSPDGRRSAQCVYATRWWHTSHVSFWGKMWNHWFLKKGFPGFVKCFCVFLLLLRFNVQSCDYSVKFPPHMVAHHFQDDKVKAGVEEDQREEIIRDLWGSHSNNQGLKSLRNPVRQILWLPSNKIHQMLCYLWKQSTSLLLK